MSEIWAQVRELIDAGDVDGLGVVLAGLDADGRAVLLPLAEAHRPERPAPEPVVLPPLEPEPEPELPTHGMFIIGWSGSEKPPDDPADLRKYLARQRLRQRERDREWDLRRLRAEAERVAAAHFERRRATLALAVIACVATPAEVVKRLNRRWDGGPGLLLDPGLATVLTRIRGEAWCTSVARGMVRRLRISTGRQSWPFTEALLRTVGVEPAATPAVVVNWMTNRRDDGRAALAGRLAEDPWLDAMLPHLFDTDQAAAALATWMAREWPPALAELASRGRVPRSALVAGCLRRLRVGGRPGRLRPYLTVLGLLEPGVDEMATHRQELIGLLPVPHLPAAEFAYRHLRALDRAVPDQPVPDRAVPDRAAPDRAVPDRAALDTATLLEITGSVLSRPEKKLFRAHIGWLGERLRQSPQEIEGLLDGLIAGLHHPTAELAGRVVDLIAEHLAALPADGRARLLAELPLLDGMAEQRLAEVLGTAPGEPAPAVPLVAEPPAEFPPPLDLGSLAGEMTTMWEDDPVRLELVLDGLLRAGRGDRSEAARVICRVLPGVWGPWSDILGALFRGATPGTPESYWYGPTVPHPLTVFVNQRLHGVAEILVEARPAGLLSTPANIAGQVDPDRVLGLLRQAEREGWQPHHTDLVQALLRLPRETAPVIEKEAGQLVSPAGRYVARWLGERAGRAEPRTWLVDVPALSNVRPARRVAMMDPGGLPAGLGDSRNAQHRAHDVWALPSIGVWPMIAPAHRDLMAAHAQPFIAPAAEDNRDVALHCLPGLAMADGPVGPAMSLTLAYSFGARREAVRLAAADALVTLAARPDWDSTAVGTELGGLTGDGQVVLRRTIQPLTEALRAGAHDAVWQITSAALPPLLAGGSRPGLADLVDLADEAARAGRHTADIPGLAAGAGGGGQLGQAARRLTATLQERRG